MHSADACVVAVCSCCGRTYGDADWALLPLCGHMELRSERPLELRNCSCGSTISRRILADEPGYVCGEGASRLKP